MANDCPKHAGQQNELQRREYDAMMRALPENQSGGGRHKCAYCAYEKGFEAGVNHAANCLKDIVLRESKVASAHR